MNFSNSFRNSMPLVVRNIIIINVILLIATMFSQNFMYEHFALFYFGSPFFKPYQIITHIFMHGGFWHLFFNMYTLWIFGSVLENMWGSKKFFLYYMVTGLGAALLHELVMYLQTLTASAETIQILMATPTVGASGAVYGLLLAYGMLFPNNVLRLLIPPIALKAKWLVLIFGAIELVSGLTGAMGGWGDNIAHFAHLGGMLFGLILILYWKKKKKLYY